MTIDINEVMKNLAQYLRLQDEAAKMADELKTTLKEYMANNNIDTITGDEHKATFKDVTTSRLDTTALKKNLPDIAAAYTKITTTKRFTFS